MVSATIKTAKHMRRFARFGNHLYNSKNVKNTSEGVLLLVKLQALVKITLVHGYFSHFLIYTNNKSREALHNWLAQVNSLVPGVH